MKGKINGGGAMRMPTSSIPTIRPWLLFLWHNRNLSTIQKLQQQQKHFIPHRIYRNHLWTTRRRRRRRPHRAQPARRCLRRRPTKEFPKKQTPSRQDASVGVD